jgi:butyryl-CoA dehydrogenase
MTDKKKGNHGVTAFIVEKGDEGFSIDKTEDKMGICASSTTELIFQHCDIPEDRLLGEVGGGFKIALSTLDGGRIGIASQALGIAQGAFDVTVEYMNARKQFGKKLSQFQALQFEMADLKTRIEAARLLVYRAADLKDKHLPYSEAAAMAKLYAAETAMAVTTKCVQYHGGYGYTKDYPVERMMRDAKITEIYEGTSEAQRLVISAHTFKK